MRRKTDLSLAYLVEVFSGHGRGAYLVAIGWTTLVVTDDVARVGQVFIVAMLTALVMCLSPTQISAASTASYFVFWGTVMVVVSVLLALRAVMRG